MKGGCGLKLYVHNKQLQKILDDPNKVIKKIGLDLARKLKQRFNELEACSNFKQYLDNGIGKPHPLVGNLDKLYGISLNKNYRLIIEPITDKLDDDSLKNCNEINIKGVMDYHDGKNEWLIP